MSNRKPDDETRTVGDASGGHSAELPESIGAYRILGKLGEGGMGVVFEAEQQNPKRRVAIKVVRGGQFIDDSRVKMFQREADALARLKHPNIGGIYESGRTADGQHFFAMELVRGESLGSYMRGRPSKLSADELRFRLGMLRTIADAVHYAHQRGVVHRDLKPSNIIVEADREGQVKILDFGLARITEGDVAAATLMTEVGAIKGTLPYMSPEQARGNPEQIDVRTDVYALGVILYEMLAGQRPYDVLKKSVAEAVRIICEESPRSLSQTIGGIRRLDPDVETIVGKALEKEADRRYGSAAALSDDIGRYLTSQPILARPPSTSYQLRKFAARNRALVGGVVATFLVLVAGIAVSTVLGLREAAQRKEAEAARDDLESVVMFQAEMLASTDSEGMGRRLMENLSRRVAEVLRGDGRTEEQVAAALASFGELVAGVNATDLALDMVDEDIVGRAVQTLDEKFGDRPLIDARLRRTSGDTYRRLGRYQAAETLLQAALATQERELGRDHPETLVSIRLLATLYRDRGRYDEAERLYLEILEARERLLGVDHLLTLESMYELAVNYRLQGRYDKAEPLHLKSLEISKSMLGNDHQTTLLYQGELAVLYKSQGHYDKAEPLYLETLEARKRLHGTDDARTLGSMNNLANLYRRQERYDEAEPLFLQTLEIQKRVLGSNHPSTLASMNNLAVLYDVQARYDEAESLYVETLEVRRPVLGNDHPYTLTSMNNLATMYRKQSRYEEAEPLYIEIFETRKRVNGSDHPSTASALYELTCLESLRGDAVKAMDWLRKAVDAGYAKADWMLKDTDLDSLRVDPGFDALVEQARSNAEE